MSVQKQDARNHGKPNSTVEHLLETRFLTSKFTLSPSQNILYNKIQLLQCRSVFNKSSSGENGNNTKENLDKDLPFINTQESPELTKAQVSFNNPKIESPLVLNNQKELDNVRARILALKSFFMKEIYDLRQEISSVRSQLEQERLHHSRNNDCMD